MKIISRINFWIKNARHVALPQSMMPALAAVVICAGMPDFSLGLSALAVIGVGLAHLGFNLLDDLFDYRSHKTGYRNTLDRAGFRARTSKCPYLVSGEATEKELKAACCVFGLLGCLCGLIILYYRGWPIAVIVAITVFLGYFYSGKPLRLSYHGLGEPVIGMIFGPLNVCGVALSAAGTMNTEIIIVGIIMGLLVTNILYTHSVLDYHADQSVNKQTFAAFFHTDQARLQVFGVIALLPYLLVIAGVAFRVLPLTYLLFWLVLPLSIALYRSMQLYIQSPETEVTWKKWYGPCGNWEGYCQAKIEWFLQRWLLARNIVTAAAVTCVLASIIEKVVY